ENYANALADFNEAIRLDPNDADSYRLRASAQWKAGFKAEALVDYDKALSVNPHSAATYRNRGDYWMECGENDKAIFDFEEAIRIDPHCFYAYSKRAAALRSKGILHPQSISAVEIEIAGELLVRPIRTVAVCVLLAKTPGVVEISSKSL